MYLKLDSNLPILYRRRCSAARCKRYRCERAMGARCSCSAYAPLLRHSRAAHACSVKPALRLQCETGVKLAVLYNFLCFIFCLICLMIALFYICICLCMLLLVSSFPVFCFFSSCVIAPPPTPSYL